MVEITTLLDEPTVFDVSRWTLYSSLNFRLSSGVRKPWNSFFQSCLDQANEGSRIRRHRAAAASRCMPSVMSPILAPAPAPASMMSMIS